MPTVTRMPLVTAPHINQRAHRGVSQNDNTTSGPTVPPVRASVRNELLAAKGHDTVSPRPTFDQDVDVIDHRVLTQRSLYPYISSVR
jgi:hypothetical protein